MNLFSFNGQLFNSIGQLSEFNGQSIFVIFFGLNGNFNTIISELLFEIIKNIS
jgi:hypothetical protein